jgi:hypothetical protein
MLRPIMYIDASDLLRNLRNRAAWAIRNNNAEALVAYVQHYSVYVHEDLAMNHPNGGEAKFLEKPVRTKLPEIAASINLALRARKSFARSLLAGADTILGFSRMLVPVDTGALKNTSKTRIVRGK